MLFKDLILHRQSVRKYNATHVEKEKIDTCLEAARMAPSASNSQPWTFIVINDDTIRHTLAKETVGPLKSFNKFVVEAPILIVFVLETPKILTELGGRLKNKEYPLIDIGIAAEHFCLQAAELGLGTCMLGWFNEKEIKDLLHIPSSKTIGLIVTLGYATDDYPLRKKIRKPVKSIVKYNHY